MSIRVRCPGCGHAFKADRKFTGRRARCPKCGDLLRIVDHRVAGDASAGEGRHDSEGQHDSEGSATAKVVAEGRTKGSSSDDTQLLRARPLDGSSETPDDEPNLVSVFADAAPAPIETGQGIPVFGASASGPTPVHSPNEATGIPTLDLGDSHKAGAGGRLHSRQKSRPLSPVLLVAGIAVAALAVVGLGAAGVVFLFAPDSDDEQVAGANIATDSPEDAGENVPQPADNSADPPAAAPSSGVDNTTAAPSAAPPKSAVEKLAPLARRHTVKLRVSKPGGDTTGSAFFVSADGWLATSARLIDGATQVGVELDGAIGATVESDGIVRIDRRRNLALISVHPSRSFNVAPLRRGEPLATGVDQYASALPPWGDAWLSTCQLRAHRTTAQLPPNILATLEQRDVPLDREMAWLELAGGLSPDGEGGPLLNELGEVSGVCLAADASQKLILAADVRHLESLLREAQASEIDLIPYAAPPSAVTFADGGDPARPSIDVPATSPDPPTAPSAAEAFMQQLAKNLADLKAKCAAADWVPASGEQYAAFQQLAIELTGAATVADEPKVPAEVRQQIGEAITDAMAPQLQWNDLPRFEAVNRLAAAGIESAASRGLYGFGEVVARPGQVTVNSQPAVGLQLIGTREVVFMPIRHSAEELRLGTRWLVVGVYRGRIEELSDDPTAPNGRRCSMIDAKYLVAFPEDAQPASP
ncbi:MAG: trypsin-like peptidase domain-containing protein [Pirellulaceae bacterium]